MDPIRRSSIQVQGIQQAHSLTSVQRIHSPNMTWFVEESLVGFPLPCCRQLIKEMTPAINVNNEHSELQYIYTIVYHYATVHRLSCASIFLLVPKATERQIGEILRLPNCQKAHDAKYDFNLGLRYPHIASSLRSAVIDALPHIPHTICTLIARFAFPAIQVGDYIDVLDERGKALWYPAQICQLVPQCESGARQDTFAASNTPLECYDSAVAMPHPRSIGIDRDGQGSLPTEQSQCNQGGMEKDSGLYGALEMLHRHYGSCIHQSLSTRQNVLARQKCRYFWNRLAPAPHHCSLVLRKPELFNGLDAIPSGITKHDAHTLHWAASRLPYGFRISPMLCSKGGFNYNGEPRTSCHGCNQVVIRYAGWTERWSEFICVDSPRIAAFGTRTNPLLGVHINANSEPVQTGARPSSRAKPDGQVARSLCIPEELLSILPST